jgi:hypothetical protein
MRDKPESQEKQADSKADDRRGTVDPAKSPVPSSPEPEERSVREGKEKLERVKPY